MPVRPEYIFKIDNVYIKTPDDIIEINTDDRANKEWKDAYKTFKPRIRDHLKRQQHARCAFCRCLISSGTSDETLEHIVSKTDYSQFITLPKNLVYCCWKCNRSKKKKNTINNPNAVKSLQTFPSTSNGFIIVNPYHDDYEQHIDFIDEVLIVAVNSSPKGENTIEFYDLARPKLAEDRARDFKLNQAEINHQLTQRLTDILTPENVLEQIKGILAEMPKWVI